MANSETTGSIGRPCRCCTPSATTLFNTATRTPRFLSSETAHPIIVQRPHTTACDNCTEELGSKLGQRLYLFIRAGLRVLIVEVLKPHLHCDSLQTAAVLATVASPGESLRALSLSGAWAKTAVWKWMINFHVKVA